MTRAGDSSGSQEIVQLATFTVGGEQYAIDIMRIKEIINPLRVTPVPRAPAFIEGVIELRGAILPVVDLRKRFDLPATPPTRATKYIIVSVAGRILGLIVDGVSEVLRISRSELRPPPPFGAADAARYFSGVCQHDGRIVMILDIDRVLTSEEKISLQGMGGSA